MSLSRRSPAASARWQARLTAPGAWALGQEVEGSRVAFAGFGEEIDGGGREDLAVESGAADVPVDAGGDLLAGQRQELVGGTHPREHQSRESGTVVWQGKSNVWPGATGAKMFYRLKRVFSVILSAYLKIGY
jgi:hypothetical protein